MNGHTSPSGTVALRVVRRVPEVLNPETGAVRWLDVLRHGLPWPGVPLKVALWRLRNIPNLWRGAWRVFMARILGLPHFYGVVWLRVFRANGEVLDLGLASLRLVTDAGATFIVDNLRGSIATIANMKFHGIGTGSTAEAATDTALVTELTTQYNPDSTRATGSQTNNGAKVYRTVGTNTVDASATIAEHGIFTQAATGGGTMLDRSVFTGVALASGDSLQTTYDFTVNSGG